jgi:hypothetical protein
MQIRYKRYPEDGLIDEACQCEREQYQHYTNHYKEARSQMKNKIKNNE